MGFRRILSALCEVSDVKRRAEILSDAKSKVEQTYRKISMLENEAKELEKLIQLLLDVDR